MGAFGRCTGVLADYCCLEKRSAAGYDHRLTDLLQPGHFVVLAHVFAGEYPLGSAFKMRSALCNSGYDKTLICCVLDKEDNQIKVIYLLRKCDIIYDCDITSLCSVAI